MARSPDSRSTVRRAHPPSSGQRRITAVSSAAAAIFYHLKLSNLTSKFGANTGELLQEVFRIAMAEGRAVVYLDEADALSLEHLLPPQQAREASARLVAALPVAPADSAKEIAGVVDECVVAETPVPFYAVGQHYLDFEQVDDEEVRACLARAWGAAGTEAGGEPRDA